jgi:PPP family 3-phenylpropionic acid transporter
MPHSNPAIVNDPFVWRLALLYAAFFGTTGWYLPFFPVWLSARGLDPAAIGVVLAAYQLARIVAMPAGTRLADRYGTLNRAIAIAGIASAASIGLLGLMSGFPAMLAAVIVMAAVYAPMSPLIDAYALKGLGQRNVAYGPVRLWGSVAFIAANLVGGVIFGIIAPTGLIWLIFAGQSVAALLAFWLVPLPRDDAVPAQGTTKRHSHLRRPAFLAIAAAGSLIQGSHAVYYGFATIDWTARGFSGSTIGVLWGLGVIGEIILFALAARVPAAIGAATLIAMGGAGAVLRWSLAALEPSIPVMIVIQLLHGASFGLTHLGTMMYLSHNAPEGARAAAQGDIATANSLMMAGASVLSGVLYGMSGSLAYAAMAAMGGLGAAFALLAGALQPHKAGTGG